MFHTLNFAITKNIEHYKNATNNIAVRISAATFMLAMPSAIVLAILALFKKVAWWTLWIPAGAFAITFGVALLVTAITIFIMPKPKQKPQNRKAPEDPIKKRMDELNLKFK